MLFHIYDSALAQPSGAESIINAIERPPGQRQELPDYQSPDEPLPEIRLPSVTPSPQKTTDLTSAHRIYVRQFGFVGNTIFPDTELGRIAEKYQNQKVTFEDLEQLRHELTLHYVNQGYVSSGAVIPDQEVRNGVIIFLIVEGKLSEIKVTENERLRSQYIRSRLRLGAGQPLNIKNLEESVRILHQDSLIRRLDAELGPGTRLGESVLKVRADEESPYRLATEFSNSRSPSVGEWRGQIIAEHRNLTGWGDTLGIRYGLTEGLDDISAYYILPLTARETTLKLRYEKSDASVIEEPFDQIDIDSESETYGITLSRPFFRTPAREFSLSLTWERRRSKTLMFSGRQPYPSSPGVQDGESIVNAIRFSQDWVSRSPTQVLAFRSVFSKGIDRDDFGSFGKFLTWLFQFQWARRLEKLRDTQVIFRTDFQFSNTSLLPPEKFSVGGAASVRGYWENQLVRDNGLAASLEFRIPVFRIPLPKISKSPEDGMVQIAPFADWGWAENVRTETPDPRTISSVGVGIRWDPSPGVYTRLYWGIPLRDVNNPRDSFQDSGIHFQVSCEFF